MNDINETINEIINHLLGKAVIKDDESGKMPIVPDDGWARKTTGDLAALLDNIGILPDAIECERCDTRFTTKEELKEHEVDVHGKEDDYELLFRKHEKLLDKFMILNKANQNRLEILEENT